MLSDKEFENIIRESIREEIALLKEGKQTLYIWSEDGGRTYGLYDKLTGSKKVPLVKGNEKTMMQLLLKISNAPKSDLEDEFSETAQGDQYGEITVDMNKLAKLKSIVKESSKNRVTESKYDDMLKKGDGHVHFVVKDLATAEKLSNKIEAKYGSTDYYKLSDGKVYLRVAPDYYEGKYIPAIERLVGQKAKPGSKETGHVKGKVVQEAELEKEKFTDPDQMRMYEAFKPGDMWSNDFDYTGMLKFGSKVKINTPLKVLEALYDSFEDVNYHSENAHLGDAISSLLAKKPNDAKKHMNVFNKACLNTLKSIK